MKNRKSNELPWNVRSIAKKLADVRPTITKTIEWRFAEVPGLVLRVSPGGTATWNFIYRIKDTNADGSAMIWATRRYKIGRYEEVKAAKAREKAEELHNERRQGRDPVMDTKASEKSKLSRAKALTFKDVFTQRLAIEGDEKARTLSDYDKALHHWKIFDKLSGPASEITQDHVAAALSEIEATGRKGTMHKVRSAISSTFRWAVKRRLVTANPVDGLGFTHKSTPIKVELTDTQLQDLWSRIESGGNLSERMRVILKLGILTGQREATIAMMRRDQLKDLDGDRPRWHVPAENTKSGLPQVVPLSKQAVEAIKDAKSISKSVWLFPSDQSRNFKGVDTQRFSHIAPDSVSQAFGRLREAVELDDVAGLTFHKLRSILVTWLAEYAETPEHVLKAILHHKPTDVTGLHYNHATMEKPVRAALQRWADHVSDWEPKANSS